MQKVLPLLVAMHEDQTKVRDDAVYDADEKQHPGIVVVHQQKR